MNIDLLKGYQSTIYERVKRSNDSYRASKAMAVDEIERLLAMYKTQFNERSMSDLQKLRLIRDAIEHWLRRYHGYVKEGYGAHYLQDGLIEKGVFEHVIPVREALDMLIQGILTVEEALNIPTCFISQENDKKLRDMKLVKNTPDAMYFFKRYENLNADFKTRDGQPIDLRSWTLENHFECFES